MAIRLEFEKPVAALEAELAALPVDSPRRAALEQQIAARLGAIYASLTPWQKVLVARHPGRPRFLAYAEALFTELSPLAGDRKFADDVAILGGPARFQGRPVMLIGQEKGDSTETRVARNFGMAKPEGYRKAARLMELADRLRLPIVTLVDTPGAFPGIDAEERGQGEAIARATEACLEVGVPLVSVIIGEGMSGGALGLAAANRLMMLEHSVYAVISPEGCASILWRDAGRAADAADMMKMTAQDLKRLGVADGIIAEPVGGAHRDRAATMTATSSAIAAALEALDGMPAEQLRAERRARFRGFATGPVARAA